MLAPLPDPRGLGNYDVNVLIAALTSVGYDTTWHDNRELIVESIDLHAAFGFILNSSTGSMLSSAKHWIAIRRIGDTWFNLDSKLERPQAFDNDEQLIVFMQTRIDQYDGQLFIITPTKPKEPEKKKATDDDDNTKNKGKEEKATKADDKKEQEQNDAELARQLAESGS